MAIPKPDPKDWLRASATELRLGDRETLRLLQESYKAVQKTLEGLPDGEGAAFGKLIQRAQMERVRRELLAEQARLFDRLGDKVSARRLRSATRAAKLSRVADRALLTLAGAGEEGKRLYDGATITAQRTIDTMLARVGISKLPLAERIYNTRVWMDGRLDALINGELAKGLNAARFAKVARDWFNPSVKGGTRYAAMRLARTEINNAFHATSITYAQDKPWVSQMNWNLSESHPTPDKCNEYADLSPWDVYAVPRKPHPQCLCNVTEVQVGEDEWMDKFIAGDFDAYLDAELDKADEQLGIKKPPQTPRKAPSSAPKQSAPAETPKPVKRIPKPKVAPPVEKTPVSKVLASSVPNKPDDGYRPGQWKKDDGIEGEIRNIAETLEKNATPEKRADQVAKNGADWARKFAEELMGGITDDSDISFTNGPHKVRFTGTLGQQRHLQVLEHIDFLQTNFPTDRNMRITIAPSKEFGRGVGGETTLGTGSMHINETVLNQSTWPGMPASKDVSSVFYVLAHEWGHSASSPEEAREHEVHNHAVDAGGMTGYGTHGIDGVRAPAEGYAEAFAEWALTKGKTTNPAALEYAAHFKWRQRWPLS